MSAVMSDPRMDFESVLSKTLPNDSRGSGRYASDLDKMINGAASREQEELMSGNLSEILNNIRDHGPAGGAHQQAADTPQPVDDSHDPVSEQVVESQQDLLSAMENDSLHLSSNTGDGRMIWQLSTLVLLVALLGVITLFQLRTDESLVQISNGLEQFSDDYVKQLSTLQPQTIEYDNAEQVAVAGNLRELETTVSQLNEEMQMLNLRLDEIGELQMTENTQLRSIIQDEIAPRLEKLAATEVAIAEATSNIVTTTKKIETSPASSIVAPEDARVDWMVNLGSFTDRNKAERIGLQLRARDLKTVIDEVSIASGTVYRISVGGFDSRGAAMEFKQTQAIELGFENSWVRQG